MSFAHLTPEQRAEAQRKSAETRLRNKAARLAAQAAEPVQPTPPVMPLIPMDEPAVSEYEEPVSEHENLLSEHEIPPPPQTPFEIFVSSLDAETRAILNAPGELEAIFAAQEKKAAEAKREKLRRAAVERANHHAQVNAGLLPAEAIEHARLQQWLNEKVTYRVELPEMSDVGLRIDGQIYFHGQSYTVTRAQYLTHRDIIYRNQQTELDFEGRSRSHHLRRRAGALDVSIGGTA